MITLYKTQMLHAQMPILPSNKNEFRRSRGGNLIALCHLQYSIKSSLRHSGGVPTPFLSGNIKIVNSYSVWDIVTIPIRCLVIAQF